MNIKKSKRAIGVLIFAVALIIITGCSSESQFQQNKIAKTELTTEDIELLDGAGIDFYYMFDIELKDKFNYVYIWFDKYEFGEKIGNLDSKGKSIILKNESNFKMKAVLTIDYFPIKVSEDVQWYFSLGDESTSVILDSHKHDDVITSIECVDEIEIEDGKDCILVGQFYKKGNGMGPLPENFFKATDNYEEMLADYDTVYVLKAKFYK